MIQQENADANPAYYAFRIRQLEAEGMTTSDAQGSLDAEIDVAPQLWDARVRIFDAMKVERAEEEKVRTTAGMVRTHGHLEGRSRSCP